MALLFVGQMSYSTGERAYIVDCAKLGCRIDGRSNRSFRRVSAEIDVVPQATGSARVRLGKTDVYVGIKVELGEPSIEAPNCGRIEFFVDYAPCGTQEIEEDESELYGHELADKMTQLWRLDPKSLKSGGLDMRQLCIVEGKACFVLYIDATVLNVDGDVLGTISIATRAAIHRLPIPCVEATYEDGTDMPVIDVDEERSTELDTAHVPVILTVGRIGNEFVVDMSDAEEAAAENALYVAVDVDGTVSGMASGFRIPVSLDTLQRMVSIAKESGVEIHQSFGRFFEKCIESNAMNA